MKKILALLLILTFVFALASCGNSIKSVEALAEKANCAMIRLTGVEITNEAFAVLPGDPEIFEHTFEINGTKCMLRFARADIDTDISGVTTENGPLFANRESDTIYIENDELRAKSWVTVDGQYVFIVFSPDWEWSDFEDLCKQYEDMKPVNWTSDVPFETYKAMTGNYMDEDGNMATIVLKGDHVEVMVVKSIDETSRKVWDMEAKLINDTLFYDKEVITVNTYDMDAGETVEEAQPDGGIGGIRVDGDTLILEKCFSEELKSLTLVKQDLY